LDSCPSCSVSVSKVFVKDRLDNVPTAVLVSFNVDDVKISKQVY